MSIFEYYSVKIQKKTFKKGSGRKSKESKTPKTTLSVQYEYNDQEDIFVHYSTILSEGYKTLVEGQYVKFDLVRTDKGLQAKNVIEIKTALV